MAGVSETHRTAPIFRQPRDNAITGVGAPDLGGPQRLSGHCLSKRPGPVAVHCALLPAKSRSRRTMRPSSPLRSEGAWRSGVESTCVAGSPASFGSRWEGGRSRSYWRDRAVNPRYGDSGSLVIVGTVPDLVHSSGSTPRGRSWPRTDTPTGGRRSGARIARSVRRMGSGGFPGHGECGQGCERGAD
jgi:hypothetical protein